MKSEGVCVTVTTVVHVHRLLEHWYRVPALPGCQHRPSQRLYPVGTLIRILGA
jgi:hypothetical protein